VEAIPILEVFKQAYRQIPASIGEKSSNKGEQHG
jgi:hypothetical protein